MSDVGQIAWVDLTVSDADAIRDFYSEVVGWNAEPQDMGGYDDYNMQPPGTDRAAAGICFAKGTNADVPPQWVIYITVEDLERSVARCTELGGKVLSGPRSGFCIIQDPAGAVAALYQAK
jgi:predicted enzyme related to lactoylglutathione lyase